MISLEDFKKIVESHMKKELDIMEMSFSLDAQDAQAFNEWYINHPYSRGIREIQELVRRRSYTWNKEKLFEHC